jgi:hypothetical protein
MNTLPNPNDLTRLVDSSINGPSDTVTTTTPPMNEKQMMLRLAFAKPNFLPMGYVPTALDVCCGRGKKNWRHQGNIAFRKIIRIRVDSYISAPTKQDKSSIVVAVVDDLRLLGGKFIKQDDTGRWYDIGDSQARDKVGHSLRDQVTALSKQQKIDRKVAPAGAGASALSSSSSPASSPSRTKIPESSKLAAAAAAATAQAAQAPLSLSPSRSAPASFFTNAASVLTSTSASLPPPSAAAATTSSYRQQQQQQQGGTMMDDYNVNPQHPFITYQQAVSQRRSEPCIPSSISALLSNSFSKRPSMGLDEHVTHGLDLFEPGAMDDLRLLPTTASMMQHHHRHRGGSVGDGGVVNPYHRGGGGGPVPVFSFVDAMEQGRVRLEPNFHQPLDASVEPTPIEQMLRYQHHHQQKQGGGVQQGEQQKDNTTNTATAMRKSTLAANFEPLPDTAQQAAADAANQQAAQQLLMYQSFLNNNNNNNNNNMTFPPPFP